MRYLTPKELSDATGLSRATITRCVQKGAPVHRWGSCGKQYRIDLNDFISWMEAQEPTDRKQEARKESYEELRRKRMQRYA